MFEVRTRTKFGSCFLDAPPNEQQANTDIPNRLQQDLTGKRVAQVLDRVVRGRGAPKVVVSGNGPEFISRALEEREFSSGIRPGKPIENAYIESFNGRLRDECLNERLFFSIDDARLKLEAWRADYNRVRPHGKLGPDDSRGVCQTTRN